MLIDSLPGLFIINEAKPCWTNDRTGLPGILTGSKPTASDLERDVHMVGRSPIVTRIKSDLKKIACADCPVLITGEAGTGKELAAKFIHLHSHRSQKPFVIINCAAIPDALLESELFGHETGAFTGASSKREGAILSANYGTVFFDEIGEMSPYAQVKLLRTIENREVWPVGGRKSLPVNVRFVASTNRNLEKLMEEGKFRADLYFRLKVVQVQLPPLSQRKEDIIVLLDHFREMFNRQFHKEVERFSQEVVEILMNYHWPGNIRELKNFVEASFANAEEQITLKDFPEWFCGQLRERKSESLFQDEHSGLIRALLDANWNKAKAAQKPDDPLPQDGKIRGAVCLQRGR